jgi:hypothetical protein
LAKTHIQPLFTQKTGKAFYFDSHGLRNIYNKREFEKHLFEIRKWPF